MTTGVGRGQLATSSSGKTVFAWFLYWIIFVAACSPFPGYDLLTVSLCLVAISISVFQVPHYRVALRVGLVPFVFGLWCLGTTFWSGLPEATVRLSVTFLLLAVVALQSVRLFRAEVILRTLHSSLRLVLLVSLFVAVVIPSVGLVSDEYESGALQGITVHRNTLGLIAVVLLMASYARKRLLPDSYRGTLLVIDCLIGLLCLVGAQSQSSFVNTGTAAGFIIASTLICRAGRELAGALWISFTLLATAAVNAVLTGLDEVTQGLGRDTTLTGRTDIWEAVLEEIQRRPATGAGFYATWWDGLPITERLWAAVGFKAYHAHNGALDLVLQVGVIGLLLFIPLVVLPIVVSIIRSARDGSDRRHVFAGGLAVVVLVGDVSESPFLTLLGWLVLLLISFGQFQDQVNFLNPVRLRRSVYG